MWIDDQILAASHRDLALEIWIPHEACVVLGRSNQLREVHVPHCEEDGIPILKRLGGGGTVLLSPSCLVVSLGLWVRDYYQNSRYFQLINQALIHCLAQGAPGYAFNQRGHSDIVTGDKKCVGTSLFRSRNFLMYQASILLSLDIEAIERYLQHPSLEPDYRRGRTHRDFLVGLHALSSLTHQDWLQLFRLNLESKLRLLLQDELIEVQDKQIPHLKSRIGEQLA